MGSVISPFDPGKDGECSNLESTAETLPAMTSEAGLQRVIGLSTWLCVRKLRLNKSRPHKEDMDKCLARNSSQIFNQQIGSIIRHMSKWVFTHFSPQVSCCVEQRQLILTESHPNCRFVSKTDNWTTLL